MGANASSDRDINRRQLAGGMRIDQTGENDQLQASDQDQNQHGGEVQPFDESLGEHVLGRLELAAKGQDCQRTIARNGSFVNGSNPQICSEC